MEPPGERTSTGSLNLEGPAIGVPEVVLAGDTPAAASPDELEAKSDPKMDTSDRSHERPGASSPEAKSAKKKKTGGKS